MLTKSKSYGKRYPMLHAEKRRVYARISHITPKAEHNYDLDMTYYYIITYAEDIHYAKDHIHYYNIWTRMCEDWDALPKHIERVDCSEMEYCERFSIKNPPLRIVLDGSWAMRGMVAEE